MGDAGYQGVEKRPEHARSGVRLAGGDAPESQAAAGAGGEEARAERRKASLRAKVEHPFST